MYYLFLALFGLVLPFGAFALSSGFNALLLKNIKTLTKCYIGIFGFQQVAQG